MGDSKVPYQKLPPGWDCKFDQATGNCYYINYFTKAMQLEDPRLRYKQLQNERCSTESIPMQNVHGSPYHVYPSNNFPAMRAFQAGPGDIHPTLYNISGSPLLSSRGHLELSPIPFLKSSLMQTPRMGNMSRRSTIQETSFTNPIDTDVVVAKIQNMFPTASENHIRLLLQKYYNREAVVISALQVEKHPVTMPGPFVTPPSQRHLYHTNSAFHMTPPARRPDIGIASHRGGGLYGNYIGASLGGSTSRTASPIPGGRFGSIMSVMHTGRGNDGGGFGYMQLHGSPHIGGEQWRSSPKPHSSPKMKLRYMKNIFPKADEMLILDVLADADNNVQHASEKLKGMGYIKRECVPQKVAYRPESDATGVSKKSEDPKVIPLQPKQYNQEQKDALQHMLQGKYPNIPERIILMALESVSYAEDRAIQILQIVQEEDEVQTKKQNNKLQNTLELNESKVDGINSNAIYNSGDNIITVILDTSTSAAKNTHIGISDRRLSSNPDLKDSIPIAIVTTPTTASTQIILSDSPELIKCDAEPTTMKNASTHLHELSISKYTSRRSSAHASSALSTTPSLSSSTSSSSSSTSKLLNSETLTFQNITTKTILARSNTHKYGINGYLYGSASKNFSDTVLDKFNTSHSRDKFLSLKNSDRSIAVDDSNYSQSDEFKSLVGRIATMGHNSELCKGPDEKILLADYVTWSGANPDMSSGHNQLASGPDASVLNERSYTPRGHNSDLCKGPQKGLAKGSIYAQLSTGTKNSPNIKCN